MTSKEALKYLLADSELLYCEHEEDIKFYLEAEKEYNIVLKDLEKLDKYKQLEEKLGCSLITIFEALENGAWVKSKEWGLCKWGMPNIFNTYDSGNTPKSQPELQLKKSGRYEYFKIKDYGKTWSLRKEDLEDDK